MTADLPPPPVPLDADLRDFPFMPVEINRLFGSTFHARASDTEWRAGFTLWLKSWHQVPAGSLPKDDIELCRLAELGRDVRTWKRIRIMALHGWAEHDDGRLYHGVVSEKAAEAWKRKIDQRARTLKARIAALEKRMESAEKPADKAHLQSLLEDLRQSLSQTLAKSVTDRATKPVTASKREGQGQGQGEGDSREEDPAPAASGASPSDGKPEDQAFRLWQAAAESNGWPEAGFLTTTRRFRLAPILTVCGGVPGFAAALERAKTAAFLHDGAGEIHRWFDFDWLLDEQHFARLMEGRYDERRPRKPARHHSRHAPSGAPTVGDGVAAAFARRFPEAGG